MKKIKSTNAEYLKYIYKKLSSCLFENYEGAKNNWYEINEVSCDPVWHATLDLQRIFRLKTSSTTLKMKVPKFLTSEVLHESNRKICFINHAMFAQEVNMKAVVTNAEYLK